MGAIDLKSIKVVIDLKSIKVVIDLKSIKDSEKTAKTVTNSPS